jgi:[acyl-carrier-protein] S-malonyltransferase
MFDLVHDSPEALPVFGAAAKLLNDKDPRNLVKATTDKEIYENRLGQILCCTQAMAAWSVLSSCAPKPWIVAGYSVGELAAWGVAGVFDPEQVLRLTVRRAKLMDDATQERSGLAAIRGLTQKVLMPLCDQHGVYIAIINGVDQFLVGGTNEALVDFVKAASAHGAQAKTIPVAVPSHTPLLKAASHGFRDIVAESRHEREMPAEVRLLSGIDGGPVFDIKEGLEKLALQIEQTVNWAACMEACRAARVTKVIELGPGNALIRLFNEAMPGFDAHSLFEFRSLSGIKHWLSGSVAVKSEAENP